MDKVYFIEYEWAGEWYIAHSYDYSFFTSYEAAEKFIETCRDAIPDGQIRIARYERTVVTYKE